MMKKIILFVFPIIFINMSVYGQKKNEPSEISLEELFNEDVNTANNGSFYCVLHKELNKYCSNSDTDNKSNWLCRLFSKSKSSESNKCKAVQVIQPNLLDDNIEKAFQQVVFSSDDITSSTSAFAYTQNEEKTTIAAQQNLKVKNCGFLGIGMNAEGSGTLFDFYSSKNWKQKTGISLSYNVQIGMGTIFFSESETVFNITKKMRKNYAIDEINKIRNEIENYNDLDLSKSYRARLTSVLDTLLTQYQFDEIASSAYFQEDATKKEKELDSLKKYNELYTLLSRKRSELNSLHKKLANAKNKKKAVEDKVTNILREYDTQNDITYGYKFWWLSLNTSFANSRYKPDTTAIGIKIPDGETIREGLIDPINNLSFSGSATLNWTRNGKNTVQFAQLGLGISTGSILNNNLIEGDVVTTYSEERQDYILQDDIGQFLGNFDQIRKNLNMGFFKGYYGGFYWKKKTLGLNASLVLYDHLESPSNIEIKNSFMFLFGPIYRNIKEEKTNLTFGIDIGWENALYDGDTNTDFVARLRVGIPFKVYKKSVKNTK